MLTEREIQIKIVEPCYMAFEVNLWYQKILKDTPSNGLLEKY